MATIATDVNWTKTLENLPKITSLAINTHLKKCGKENVGPKGYKYFVENYIRDVYVGKSGNDASNTSSVYVKGKSRRSQKKSDDPHAIQLELNKDGQVARAQCSCKAGSGGHCNHVFAMLYLLVHWTLLGVREIAADKTCTSLPQEWHKPRRDDIEAQPVMKCVFAKSSKDRDDTRKRKPVTCNLYDATKKAKISTTVVTQVCEKLGNESKVPPFSYLLRDQGSNQNINTVMGNVPLGAYLGYQLYDQKNKSYFNMVRSDEKILPPDRQHNAIRPFPDIPIVLDNTDTFPLQNSPSALLLFNKISVTTSQAHTIQKSTVQQALSADWRKERKFRLTASNFGRVLSRKREPTEPFMNNIFECPDISNVQSVRHGKQNETLARTIYCRKMQKKVHRLCCVYESGLVVNPTYPYLGATPDGKVFDPTEEDCFGLLEIKCPYTWRNSSFLHACQDNKFYCQCVDGLVRLKREHNTGYYAQVQGQLALSGLSWCDFVVYLTGSRSMNVERIYFNSLYWRDTVLPKMRDFYEKHCIKYLSNHLSV